MNYFTPSSNGPFPKCHARARAGDTRWVPARHELSLSPIFVEVLICYTTLCFDFLLVLIIFYTAFSSLLNHTINFSLWHSVFLLHARDSIGLPRGFILSGHTKTLIRIDGKSHFNLRNTTRYKRYTIKMEPLFGYCLLGFYNLDPHPWLGGDGSAAFDEPRHFVPLTPCWIVSRWWGHESSMKAARCLVQNSGTMDVTWNGASPPH